MGRQEAKLGTLGLNGLSNDRGLVRRHAECNRDLVLLLEMRHELGERDIRLLVDQGEYFSRVDLEPRRALVAAARLGVDAGRLPPLL